MAVAIVAHAGRFLGDVVGVFRDGDEDIASCVNFVNIRFIVGSIQSLPSTPEMLHF